MPNSQVAACCRDLALTSSHPYHKPAKANHLRPPLRHEREFSEKKPRKFYDHSAELGEARQKCHRPVNANLQSTVMICGDPALTLSPHGSKRRPRMYLRAPALLLRLPQQLRQLGDVGRDPPRLVAGQRLSRGPWVIEIGYDEPGVAFLDRPERLEAAGGHGRQKIHDGWRRTARLWDTDRHRAAGGLRRQATHGAFQALSNRILGKRLLA